MKKPYCCFCKHVKTYKNHYVLGLFGSFAIVKMILLMVGFFGALYHSQYHTSASGPAYIDPAQCSSATQIDIKECEALVDIYNSTQGTNRTNSSNRGVFPNVCSRYGVVCGGNHVTHLYLSNNNLNGEIPESIQHLPNLIGMHIGYNSIIALHPNIQKLTKLEQLFVNNNLLTTLPSEIGKLENLLVLNASYNQLSKQSFSYLFDLKKIQYIYFSHNFVNNIEYGYVSLADTLVYLDLSYNQLRDFDTIGNTLSDTLKYLYLRHNRINRISSNIGDNLKQLLDLDVGKNLLTNDPVNHLGFLKKITHLRLDHNLISGIPNSFSEFSKIGTLKLLNMSYNKIETIQYIPDITTLERLSLANNIIYKMFPLDKLTHLKHLDLGFNRLKGDLSGILTEFIKIKDSLTSFSLRHNQLEKTIPEDIMSLTELENGGCQIDYNWFSLVMKPTLEARLDTKCLKNSEDAHYENTNRRNQYTLVKTLIKSTALSTNQVSPGDEIEMTIDVGNMSDNNFTVDQLRLSLFKDDSVFSIIDPSDGVDHVWGATFDDNDPCLIDLKNTTTGPYYNVLDTRAITNGYNSINDYLTISDRDRDGYQLGEYDNFYSFPRGKNFYKRTTNSTYNAFNFIPFTRQAPSFHLALHSRLFAIRPDDIAIQGCGIGGKPVITFPIAPLDAGATKQIVLTLKIHENAVPGTYTLEGIVETTNRLYLEDDAIDNKFNLTLNIKESGPPPEFPLTGICDLYNAYTGGQWMNVINISTILMSNPIGFTVENFPYLQYFLAVSYMNNYGFSDIALTYMNQILARQHQPLVNNSTEFRDAVAYLNPIMLSGIVPGIVPLQGTIYDQGIENICSTPVSDCGNGILDPGEICDGSNLNSESCMTQGFNSGDLACNESCTAFDTTNCMNENESECGNGIIESGEVCDTLQLNGKTCASFGYSLGTLSCTASCTFDTSLCKHSSSGGGGGGGGGLTPDYCPDGDYTQSYYDKKCGTKPIQQHQAAEVTDRPIMRKELAEILSVFAMQVLGLYPDRTIPCEFSDISYLSNTIQQHIKNACQLKIMGYHEDGESKKYAFDPEQIVNIRIFVTALSRLLYDGKFNFPLGTSTPRYLPHLIQLEKIGLIEPNMNITQNSVISILDRIQKNPSFVDRPDISIHGAATTSPAITRPATSINQSIKTLLQDLKRFINPGYIIQTVNEIDDQEQEEDNSHGAAEEEQEETTAFKTKSAIRMLREDLGRFFR